MHSGSNMEVRRDLFNSVIAEPHSAEVRDARSPNTSPSRTPDVIDGALSIVTIRDNAARSNPEYEEATRSQGTMSPDAGTPRPPSTSKSPQRNGHKSDRKRGNSDQQDIEMDDGSLGDTEDVENETLVTRMVNDHLYSCESNT